VLLAGCQERETDPGNHARVTVWRQATEGEIAMRALLWWFLYTRLGQWVSRRVTGGWCFVSKGDERFVVTDSTRALPYAGDPSAAPDKGISNQRNAWKTWILFRVPHAQAPRFVAVDIYDGKRMACLGKGSIGGVIAIRVGHEDAVIRLVARASLADENAIRPILLARWREGEEWPLGSIGKEEVLFL